VAGPGNGPATVVLWVELPPPRRLSLGDQSHRLGALTGGWKRGGGGSVQEATPVAHTWVRRSAEGMGEAFAAVMLADEAAEAGAVHRVPTLASFLISSAGMRRLDLREPRGRHWTLLIVPLRIIR
jgi:hypothetical protein